MLKRAAIVTMLLAAPVLQAAPAKSAPPPIEGIWKVAEVITTGAGAATDLHPQASQIMIWGGYYSYLRVRGTDPRPSYEPAKDPAALTDAEKIARYEQWRSLTANAGTYEIKGTKIIRRPLVAKDVIVMTTNPPIEEEFTFEGGALWLTSRSAPGQPASETRVKLVRMASTTQRTVIAKDGEPQ